ncbi:MAG: hypothetical protein AAGH99_13300 [Planctomycetota bacterium]
MTAYELTLAQGSGSGSGFPFGQFLVYGVIAVIFVSTMIKNAINEANKKKRREASRQAGDSPQGGASLDEIAARRRAQLQDMARQRGGGRGTSAGPGTAAGAGDDMANLSMAERIARARAAQQAQTRGAPAKPNPRANPLPSERPAPRRPEPTRTQSRADAARQRAELQRQQREALARRQRQATQQAQRSRPPAPRPVSPPQPAAQPKKEVRRTVEDTSALEVGSARRQREVAESQNAGPLINFRKLSRKDLQRAFILKEILDRPVAERDPLADVNNG